MAFAAGAAIALAAVGIAFESGRRFGQGEWQSGAQQLEVLVRESNQLGADNQRLRRELATLSTSRGVEQQAQQEVRSMLMELERKVQSQREELDFYRTIVSPKDGVAGLRIQDFRVRPSAQGSLYHLQLVLVQAAKHDKPVAGIVEFRIEGVTEGRPTVFTAQELAAATEGAELAFSFRYFKDLEQDVVLPPDFVPDRVVVEVSPEDDPDRAIRQSFDWSVKS
ncbi:MAG: DUF6776 family protein [Pseudomonadota bacterium]